MNANSIFLCFFIMLIGCTLTHSCPSGCYCDQVDGNKCRPEEGTNPHLCLGKYCKTPDSSSVITGNQDEKTQAKG
uniref:U-scoloptoxin(09)-Sm3a n=1 Tax=Scolopendra morsitans TaxID=943129 RepID=TX93A_SCOMO|nr:RecName: Full=U-scoloptoxin(09)-Sm3a; Short=U-SLPTX(09)-Sm3a; AltName: Full=U-SLPTX-Sm3a; Flags: Precursor [Scolopendra morsitans]AHY22604.1 U-SLPTX-Sm3a [Scolopendra morsitans]